MSNQYAGGFISKTPPTVTTSSAQGMWTLSQQAQYQKAGVWPIYAVTGQQEYTSPGTYSWVAPTGVTSVSAVVVGGGGGGNSFFGGGALAWKNNMTVTPGNSYTVVVGVGGVNAVGGYSYAICGSVLMANGGGTGTQGESCFTGQGGGKGGKKGNNAGGGAGGYAGQGGQGGCAGTAGNAGVGGAGGGGGGAVVSNFPTCRRTYYGAGGGVGIYGQGSNGTAGAGGGSTGGGGGGGSSGCAGGTTSNYSSPASGGAYGGGGGSSVLQMGPYVCCNWASTTAYWGAGSGGAVRIIWPGTTRSFPSTNTGNL